MSEREPDENFGEIRRLLAQAPLVEPRPDALERIIAAVAADSETAADSEPAADSETAADSEPTMPVVDLSARRALRAQRWAPRVAAAAVVIAIVGAVVGGVGTDTRIPAVGDLVASHEAAAAETMPETAREMPMDDAHDAEPTMPESMWITAAFKEAGDTVHLVYADGGGGVVSVFRQAGDTDLAELSSDGDVEMMGDAPVWTAEVAEMHVAVVDGEGYVWTVVADHHDHAMMMVMTGELPTRSPSLLDRVRDMADALLEPWRLGG